MTNYVKWLQHIHAQCGFPFHLIILGSYCSFSIFLHFYQVFLLRILGLSEKKMLIVIIQSKTTLLVVIVNNNQASHTLTRPIAFLDKTQHATRVQQERSCMQQERSHDTEEPIKQHAANATREIMCATREIT